MDFLRGRHDPVNLVEFTSVKYRYVQLLGAWAKERYSGSNVKDNIGS